MTSAPPHKYKPLLPHAMGINIPVTSRKRPNIIYIVFINPLLILSSYVNRYQ